MIFPLSRNFLLPLYLWITMFGGANNPIEFSQVKLRPTILISSIKRYSTRCHSFSIFSSPTRIGRDFPELRCSPRKRMNGHTTYFCSGDTGRCEFSHFVNSICSKEVLRQSTNQLRFASATASRYAHDKLTIILN